VLLVVISSWTQRKACRATKELSKKRGIPAMARSSMRHVLVVSLAMHKVVPDWLFETRSRRYDVHVLEVPGYRSIARTARSTSATRSCSACAITAGVVNCWEPSGARGSRARWGALKRKPTMPKRLIRSTRLGGCHSTKNERTVSTVSSAVGKVYSVMGIFLQI
jgi:hypothetical protein